MSDLQQRCLHVLIYRVNIKLGQINEYQKSATIGLAIGDKDFWGKGIATMAISLVTNYGFMDLELEKICAGCYEHNLGSKKAFLKTGYQVVVV